MTTTEMVAAWIRLESLTPAKKRIVAAIGEGCYDIKTIAEQLGIAYETVKGQLYWIYKSTGVPNMAQLAVAVYLHSLLQDREIAQTQEKPLSEILTSRELAIASFIADGKSNSAIADTLGIDTMTVKRHNAKIFVSLGFSHRAEVAVRVIREQFSIAQQHCSPAPS
jgi:DNA-binding NarL/FixJ family response regulator